MDDKKSGKFSRLRVPKHRYEKTNKSTKYWWQRLFKILEEDAAIPEHQRIKVVCDIFPEKILERIHSIMSLKVQCHLNEKNSLSSTSSSSLRSSDYRRYSIMTIQSKSIRLDDVAHSNALQLVQDVVEKENFIKRSVGPNNPYMNFFKRSNDVAAIWRKPTPAALETKHLTERAEIVTERVAVDFVKWVRKLSRDTQSGDEGQSMDSDSITKMFEKAFGTTVPNISAATTNTAKPHKETTKTIKFQDVAKPEAKLKSVKPKTETDTGEDLDVPHVMKMFEVGAQFDASTSLKVAVKEMPAVMKSIAEAHKLPKMFSRKILHKLIRNDIKESRKETKLTAFGKCLPIELRCRLPDNNESKWNENKHLRKDVATMATVWDGITDLCSTRRYCQWLYDNPHIDPPQYLIDRGMLNPETVEPLTEFCSEF